MDRLTGTGRRLAALVGLAGLLAVATPGAAQDRDRLRDRCEGGGDPAGRCLDGALAVEAVTGGVGLALSGGNEFPGSSSTLGRRFGTTPRVAAGARFGLVDIGVPDIGAGAGSAGEASSWVPSLQASLAVGLFDGFRPRPTIGGVLAVDVMATGGVALLPSGGGYDGAVAAFGYGVRVGVIRESFTLPGITLSVLRRHGGAVEWKGVDGALDGAVALDGVTTTSVRGTVGREFLALGIQAGLGWDRAKSEGTFVPAGGSPTSGSVAFDDFSADRVLFFGGVTATWLVTQFHGELGYASGYDARPGADPTPTTPRRGASSPRSRSASCSEARRPMAAPDLLTDADRLHLERAVELGRRGWGRVHPNPMVGCVLVREGEVVAEGWHEVFGGPHAETVALEAAGRRARGSTAYVSLEPCRHEGKTPACTRALVASGVVRVVFGAADPGEESGGGGGELARAGVEVVGPVFDRARARRLNPAFHHRFGSERPWVALKLAISLDAGVAEGPGRRTTLTGAEARREVHRLRAGFDGLVIGGVTARVDDPLLTVREGVEPRVPPVRIVLDPGATLASDAALFRDVEQAPVWVFTRDDAPEAELERLEAVGASVHPTAFRGPHELDLHRVLSFCREAGLSALLCEGGGRLGAALQRAGLIDRLHLFVAPRVLGDGAVPAFPGWTGEGRWTPAAPPTTFGVDTLLTYDRLEEA